MALLVLIVLGSTIGWLATILTRVEEAPAVLRHILIGSLATLAVGLFVNSGTFLGGLSWTALGGGIAGGTAALAIYYFAFVKRSEA